MPGPPKAPHQSNHESEVARPVNKTTKIILWVLGLGCLLPVVCTILLTLYLINFGDWLTP